MEPDSGEPDAAALRDRVADLEQTVAEQQATIDSLSSPPASRRGVLAALTGVAGAGALGAYSQRGAAQAAGQVGTQSEPVDVFANAIDAGTVNTSQAHRTSDSPIVIGSVGRREDFDGGDADARLDNALAAASSGDTIHLEAAAYTADRDLTNAYSIVGTLSGGFVGSGAGTRVTGEWTIGQDNRIGKVYFRNSTPIVSARDVVLYNSDFNQAITVTGDSALLYGLSGFGNTVTFESGTGGGLVDASVDVSVTDNGSNTVGDIS